MGFGELMTFANSVPGDLYFAASGLWVGTVGALGAAACGILAATTLRRPALPQWRMPRIMEASATR